MPFKTYSVDALVKAMSGFLILPALIMANTVEIYRRFVDEHFLLVDNSN